MASTDRVNWQSQIVLVGLAIAALGHGARMAVADDEAVPRGDERVKSVWLFDVASDAPFCADAALADSQGLFVAGHAWSEADGERLWLWRIDRAGKRLWEQELARPKIAEEIKVITLLEAEIDDDTQSGESRATVVIGQGQLTIVRTYDASGGTSGEVTLAGKNYASGATRFTNGDFLLFGTEIERSRQATPAWAARFDRNGKQLWRVTLDPTVDAKRIMPWARPVLSPGHYHINQLQAGVAMGDSSAVLVGITGDLNKFGQGPSKLWLVRVSDDGEQLAQALVKDGRFFGGATSLIVRRGDDVLVPYTTAQLPAFGAVLTASPPSAGGRITCFDAKLNTLWEKPLPNSALPGAVAICGTGPYEVLSASADDVSVRRIDGEGNELWESQVKAPESSVFPVVVGERESSGEIVAVCNYLRHQARNEKVRPGPQVMVFTVK